MFDAIRRWMRPSPAAETRPPAGHAGVAAWAEARGYEFHASRSGDGFTVIGRLGDVPWRLEWGASQRPYVTGHELRMRCEPGCAGDLSIVLLDRPLHKAMERMLYEQYVESVQTRIDNQTPPEMRWLVMSPRMSSAALGSLHDRLAAHGNDEGWLQQWLAGPFGEALQGLGGASALAPLVFVVGRGRLWLRTAQSDPDVPALEAWVALFESAAAEARKACRTVREETSSLGSQTQPA